MLSDFVVIGPIVFAASPRSTAVKGSPHLHGVGDNRTLMGKSFHPPRGLVEDLDRPDPALGDVALEVTKGEGPVLGFDVVNDEVGVIDLNGIFRGVGDIPWVDPDIGGAVRVEIYQLD